MDLVANYLSINKNDLIKPKQVHGDNIEIVDDRLEYPNCDALILTEHCFINSLAVTQKVNLGVIFQSSLFLWCTNNYCLGK